MMIFNLFLWLMAIRGFHLDEELANRFRSIRSKTGLSQKDFAATLDISQSAIAEIERGSREPSRNMMVALANKYHISLDWLLLGVEPTPGGTAQDTEDVAALKKEISDLEGKIRDLEAENKEISRELLERMRQLVDLQNHQLGVVS
ncbi:MAG: helix-turn-helix domain-containing protein [Treponema sp.]|jgi:transcriptional regulator with XRE-family HTH domain|nr:helix-turn-helix domain-containing protein [Treponema sp.]